MSGGDSGATKPVLLVVEDNPEDLKLIAYELRKRYGEDYHVVCDQLYRGGHEEVAGMRVGG